MIDSLLPQLDRLFDYAIPEQLAEECAPGVRVRVPLSIGARIADGYVIEVAESSDFVGELREIDAVVSPVPVLAPEVWRLARRLADRSAGNASDIIRLAVPKRQVRVETKWLSDDRADASTEVKPVEPAGYAPGLLAGLVTQARRAWVAAIPRLTAISTPEGERWIGQWAVLLAAAASHSLAQGRSAIIAVPDYRDQEQVLAALSAVVPAEQVLRVDARQPNAARYREHLRALGDAAHVIVGNRSAVYAPARNLGLIALWNDGDPLHGEPLAPYVHARDAALVRQEQQGCALMFASYAPTSETQRLVEVGWLVPIQPQRVEHPRFIPTISQWADGPAASARIPSTAWKQAREALALGPVLVQVGRPGYAPGLACADCNSLARCETCDGPLSTRRAGGVPACTWCGALAPQWKCRSCTSSRLLMRGQGSQRTAEDLGKAFPGVRVIISDGERPIERVSAAPALIIATRGAEPIADGGYRAVLLLDGERMLARESLRIAEDCLRWWVNAASLAAPGAPCMLAGVGGDIAAALAT